MSSSISRKHSNARKAPSRRRRASAPGPARSRASSPWPRRTPVPETWPAPRRAGPRAGVTAKPELLEERGGRLREERQLPNASRACRRRRGPRHRRGRQARARGVRIHGHRAEQTPALAERHDRSGRQHRLPIRQDDRVARRDRGRGLVGHHVAAREQRLDGGCIGPLARPQRGRGRVRLRSASRPPARNVVATARPPGPRSAKRRSGRAASPTPW